MSALLEARDLSVGYGGNAVVQGVNLTVAAGEIVVLLGPNGVGKTTTVLTLVGELAPIAGDVLFAGAVATDPLHRRAARGLSFVPEERSVFTRLSVRHNLNLGRCDLDRALRLFGELEPLLGRRAGLLSGGEQQMLTLARALYRPGAHVLVADELSLGLAPKSVGRLLAALRSAADAGMAVLLVEQHVHRVLDIADRVHVLSQGRVRYSGAAADARAQIDEIQGHYLREGRAGTADARRPHSQPQEEAPE